MNQIKKNFQHDITYRDFKDLARRTDSDKDLGNQVASNSKCDKYQRGLDSTVYRFFHKKSTGSGIRNEFTQNQQLAEELHTPIFRKF